MKHALIDTLPAIVHPSRAGFVAWLERQPAARRYSWNLAHRCVVALYLTEACGVSHPQHAYPEGFEGIVGPDYYRIAQREPWTCGAALARLRASEGNGG